MMKMIEYQWEGRKDSHAKSILCTHMKMQFILKKNQSPFPIIILKSEHAE